MTEPITNIVRPRPGVDATARIEQIHRIEPDRERPDRQPRRRKPRKPPADPVVSRDDDGRLHVDVRA
jgi:hypothetical protein